MEKTSLQFIKRCSPYQEGEIAGFPPEEATRYIKAGAAVVYNPDGPTGSSEEDAGKASGEESGEGGQSTDPEADAGKADSKKKKAADKSKL